jgi:hypothetical protein
MSDVDAQPEAWPRAEVIVHKTTAEIVVEENPTTIEVTTPVQATIIVETSGPQGAAGPMGPTGPTGPAGGNGNGNADVGDFQFDATTAYVDDNQTMHLQALNNNADEVGAQLVLDPGNNAARIEAYGSENDTAFYATSNHWSEGTWLSDNPESHKIQLDDQVDVVDFISSVLDFASRTRIYVDEEFAGYYSGCTVGSGGVTIFLSGGTPPAEPVTFSQLNFVYTYKSKIEVDYNTGAVNIEGKDLDVRIFSDDDVFIEAGGDDILLRANDDIRFTSNWNSIEEGPEYYWRMNSEGRFELPGAGYIENAIEGSGEGLNDSIQIVPHDGLGTDQYLVIEPTGGTPNHVHLRAGGNIDESAANIILGGEKNSVIVSDTDRAVAITTRPTFITNNVMNENVSNGTEFLAEDTANIQTGYTVNVGGTDYIVDSATATDGVMTVTANGAVFTAGQTYTFTYNSPWYYQWTFDSEGILYGPAMGGLWVTGISGKSEEWPLYVGSPQSVVLDGSNGEFLSDANIPGNQIATLSDRAYIRVNVPTSSLGQAGDVAHLVADDASHHYFCTGTYDGTTHIWKRIAWSNDTWPGA